MTVDPKEVSDLEAGNWGKLRPVPNYQHNQCGCDKFLCSVFIEEISHTPPSFLKVANSLSSFSPRLFFCGWYVRGSWGGANILN